MINLEVALRLSLKNCHVKGLYSIVTGEAAEGLLTRIFIHEPGGALGYTNCFGDSPDLPLAIHPHRYSIRITGIKGLVRNRVFRLAPEGYKVKRWIYTSGITDKESKFELNGARNLYSSRINHITPKDSILMHAEELHTVVCPPDRYSIWEVKELKKAEIYSNYAYSNADLSKYDSSTLYQPFDNTSEIVNLLFKALTDA